MSTHIWLVGIDPSSKRLAFFVTDATDQNIVACHIVRLAERDKPMACKQAYLGTRRVLKKLQESGEVVLVGLELPVLGIGGPGSTIPQARINGAVSAAIAVSGCKQLDANNQSWKSKALGCGRIPKGEAKRVIGERLAEVWPVAFAKCDNDGDKIDSAGICLYTLRAYLGAAKIMESGVPKPSSGIKKRKSKWPQSSAQQKKQPSKRARKRPARKTAKVPWRLTNQNRPMKGRRR